MLQPFLFDEFKKLLSLISVHLHHLILSDRVVLIGLEILYGFKFKLISRLGKDPVEISMDRVFLLLDDSILNKAQLGVEPAMVGLRVNGGV